MFAFRQHRRPNPLASAVDDPLFVLLAFRQQKAVQLFQVPRRRNWHEVIPPKVAVFILHTALLVSLPRRAEISCESPVRSERDKSRRLFPPVPAQDFLHRARQIVEAQFAKDSPKMVERKLVRLQKRLLRCVQIGPMKRPGARHAPHAEGLYLLSFPVHVHPGLVPVNLPFAAPTVGLRYKRLSWEPLAKLKQEVRFL